MFYRLFKTTKHTKLIDQNYIYYHTSPIRFGLLGHHQGNHYKHFWYIIIIIIISNLSDDRSKASSKMIPPFNAI